jgi:hypothetical protein
MSTDAVRIEDIPERIQNALVDEYGESQDSCVRGYVPSQSLQWLMDFLDDDQIQRLTARRTVKDDTESFGIFSHSLPDHLDAEEQLKREVVVDYDRSKHYEFEWEPIQDFLVDSGIDDLAVSKLIFRMEHDQLRDQLFDVLQNGINYPSSYKSEFTDPFYFVMESRAPQTSKDYDMVDKVHDDGELKELGWNPRTLDLMSIWSHHAFTDSSNKPMGVTQYEIEEYAFNQRESDQPVFGAVNSMLAVNKWRQAFSRGKTELRHFDWEEREGWVRSN